MDIIKKLHQTALKRSRDYTDSSFLIRGLWRTELLFRPNVNERLFDYTYILAQTEGQGCCYCKKGEYFPLDRSLMGKDARKLKPKERCVEIALLDAVYSVFERRPVLSFTIEGSSIDKTDQRTKIVIDEVFRELEKSRTKNRKVVNVGAVGNFIQELKRRDIKTFATDFHSNLVGETLHDVRIEHGNKTIEYIRKCDLALVTGMTLATGTLEDIIEAAKNYGTKLVMFCETGANFAEEYCKYGVDVVISEPFPFYIFQGVSRIEVFRRG